MSRDADGPTGGVGDEALDESSALTREKALALSAAAACAWCERGAPSKRAGSDLVTLLMDASAWATRARRPANLPPLSVGELIDAFSRPIDEWLPGVGDFPLVENVEPTPICMEIVDATGSSQLEEVEQNIIKQAMANVAAGPDASAAYAAFRRFLVEHAHALRTDAARAMRAVRLDLGRLYAPVPQVARLASGGSDVFYPCPRCNWPMTIRDADVTCVRSRSCLAAGARFRMDDSGIVALGPLKAPTPIPCDAHCALLPGIWRYTVLPGLEELDLAARLEQIPGVRVELWPYVDAYDLDVRLGDASWRVDVKDHAFANGLARHLVARPTLETTWIVVPDARRDQVALLRRGVPSDAGYRFASSSDFVRRVTGAA